MLVFHKLVTSVCADLIPYLNKQSRTNITQDSCRRWLNSVDQRTLQDEQKPVIKQVCKRCVNHNWTTDDLLKMACVKLSRSNSKPKEDFRIAKSLDDLSTPESGYSSTSNKVNNPYPYLYFRSDSRPTDPGFRIAFTPESLTELMEIQRVSKMIFDDRRDVSVGGLRQKFKFCILIVFLV